MLFLLRRLGANLIDAIIFFAALFLASGLLARFTVPDGDFEVEFPILAGFLAAIALPIFCFSSTIGEKVFRLHPYQLRGRPIKGALLFKYMLAFACFTLKALDVPGFFKDLLSTYTIFNIREFFIWEVYAALVMTNAIFFVVNSGRFSLFDRMFGLSYASVPHRRWYFSAGFAVTIFLLMTIETMIIEWKFHGFFPTKRVIAYGNSMTQIRFPPEGFDQYVVGGQIYCRIMSTDYLVTTSDVRTFIQDKYLLQRQIQVQINDSLVKSAAKRAELCSKLIDYSWQILSLLDTNSAVKQTKIELVNLQHLTPFIGITRSYIYYFDDTAGRYGLYGGFNWDTLTLYYIRTQKNIRDSLANAIASLNHISKDSAAFYLDQHDTSELHRLFTAAVVGRMMATNLGPLIDPRVFRLQPIPFDSVKPIGHTIFTLSYAMFPIFGNSFYDTQEVGTIGLRNSFSLIPYQ
jgi:RDD family